MDSVDREGLERFRLRRETTRCCINISRSVDDRYPIPAILQDLSLVLRKTITIPTPTKTTIEAPPPSPRPLSARQRCFRPTSLPLRATTTTIPTIPSTCNFLPIRNLASTSPTSPARLHARNFTRLVRPISIDRSRRRSFREDRLMMMRRKVPGRRDWVDLIRSSHRCREITHGWRRELRVGGGRERSMEHFARGILNLVAFLARIDILSLLQRSSLCCITRGRLRSAS